MRKVLVVVDMQNDFIDGSLATKEAELIVDRVLDKIESYDGEVYFTQDTHTPDYLNTQEGKKLPVKHCIKGTKGWEIHPRLAPYAKKVFEKETFGSKDLAKFLEKEHQKRAIDQIELIGLCTDICIISNAMMIKGFLPEVEIVVDQSCSAGVNPESHNRALESMKTCQIKVI